MKGFIASTPIITSSPVSGALCNIKKKKKPIQTENNTVSL
jgi:hypothetical protein